MYENRLTLGPVDSMEALLGAVGQVSESNPGCLLLFRGQNNLHPTLRSGLSRPNARYQPDVEQGLSAVAGSILGHDSVTAGNVPFRKAVLQHYGYKTHYVDVTADLNVALWFASHKFEPRTVFYGGRPSGKLNKYATRNVQNVRDMCWYSRYKILRR
jgi:hypothetical protein